MDDLTRVHRAAQFVRVHRLTQANIRQRAEPKLPIISIHSSTTADMPDTLALTFASAFKIPGVILILSINIIHTPASIRAPLDQTRRKLVQPLPRRFPPFFRAILDLFPPAILLDLDITNIRAHPIILVPKTSSIPTNPPTSSPNTKIHNLSQPIPLTHPLQTLPPKIALPNSIKFPALSLIPEPQVPRVGLPRGPGLFKSNIV